MERRGRGVCLFIVLSLSGVRPDDCDILAISGAWNATLNVEYHEHAIECIGRDIYQSGRLYLYYTSNYWIVYNTFCDPNSQSFGYLRTNDLAPEPIYIRSQWEEHNLITGKWQPNSAISLQCTDKHYDDGDHHDGLDDEDIWIIVGVTITAVAAIIGIVLCFVYCPKKNLGVKPAPPVASSTPHANQMSGVIYTRGTDNVMFASAGMAQGGVDQYGHPIVVTSWPTDQIPMSPNWSLAYNQDVGAQEKNGPPPYMATQPASAVANGATGQNGANGLGYSMT